MNFIFASTFHQSLGKLDASSRARVKEAVFDFQYNQKGEGFQFHRIDDGRDKNMWTARVNDDLRMVIHHKSDNMVFCYAGHHDDAYRWGETRRLEVHPTTGAAQLIEVKERVEEIIRQVVEEIPTEAPLFDKHAPDYLLALGLPAEYLPAFKTIGLSAFLEVAPRLPQEVQDRLYDLADGKAVAIPAPAESKDPFRHPDAQQRFWVVESQDELRRALESTWEQWLVFLHPTQRSVVERKFKGPALVAGGAGTGKTVVGIHRAARLAQAGGTVLLTTFSKTLAARLALQTNLLMGEASEARKRITVVNLHRLATDVWRNELRRPFTLLRTDELASLISSARQEVRGAAEFETQFLIGEWNAIVDSWGIDSWEAYRDVARTGRSMALGAKKRKVLWDVFQRVHTRLEAAGKMSFIRLCAGLARDVGATTCRFQHAVVDEAQDFGPSELTLVRALVRQGEDDLFFCGDAGQRIFKAPFAWSSVAIDVRGRSSRLYLNYRTTEEIRCAAEKVLPSLRDANEADAGARATRSVLRGVAPQIETYPTVDREIDAVARWLKELIEKRGLRPRELALFAHTDALLTTRAREAVKRAGLNAIGLEEDTSNAGECVSVGTMHRAKGLEFRGVAVMGCDADVLPLASHLASISDPADRDTFLASERQLLYVALTRAREHLLVTSTGARTDFLR